MTDNLQWTLVEAILNGAGWSMHYLTPSWYACHKSSGKIIKIQNENNDDYESIFTAMLIIKEYTSRSMYKEVVDENLNRPSQYE